MGYLERFMEAVPTGYTGKREGKFKLGHGKWEQRKREAFMS